MKVTPGLMAAAALAERLSQPASGIVAAWRAPGPSSRPCGCQLDVRVFGHESGCVYGRPLR